MNGFSMEKPFGSQKLQTAMDDKQGYFLNGRFVAGINSGDCQHHCKQV
jgi:hypothetical protein